MKRSTTLPVRRGFSLRALGVCCCASALAFWAGRLSVVDKPAGAARDKIVSLARTIPEGPAAATTALRDDLEARWRKLSAQPGAPARDKIMTAHLARLAVIDPARALGLASAETNRSLHEELLQAALRGWASVDAEAASRWLLAQPDLNRTQAMAALLAGAVQSPADAVRMVLKMIAEDPSLAREGGAQLISALDDVGEFERAVEFAQQGGPACRNEWLTSAFIRWSSYQPERAATVALELTDTTMRQTALQAVISGWAQSAPAELAEFATALPAGPERTNALRAALCTWASENPKAVATWLEQRSPNAELDAGATAVATSPSVLGRLDVAVAWARRIVDPALRSSTMAAILRDLTNRDPAAARSFAENSPDLQSGDRAGILAGVAVISSQ